MNLSCSIILKSIGPSNSEQFFYSFMILLDHKLVIWKTLIKSQIYVDLPYDYTFYYSILKSLIC